MAEQHTELGVTIQPGESVQFDIPVPKGMADKKLQELARDWAMLASGDYTTTLHDELITFILRRKRIAMTKVPETRFGRLLWNILGGARYWRHKNDPFAVITCDK